MSDTTILPNASGRQLRGRSLVYRYEGFYYNETTQEEEWLLIVEALELKMDPGE